MQHKFEKIINQAYVGLNFQDFKNHIFFADSIILYCFPLISPTSQWATMSKDNNKILLYQSPAFSIPSTNFMGVSLIVSVPSKTVEGLTGILKKF